MKVTVLKGNYPKTVHIEADKLDADSAILAVVTHFGYRTQAFVYTDITKVGYKVNVKTVYPVLYYLGDGKWRKGNG